MDNTKPMKNTKTYAIIITALFAALTAAFSQIFIPIGPVPINLALLAVFTAAGLLSPGRAVLSQVIFLLLGAAGVPVFSGFHGGFASIVGPTGGYLVGYVVAALTISLMLKWLGKKVYTVVPSIIVGLALCYAFGTAWFVISTGTGILDALMVCVVPFLIGDAIKTAVATLLILRLKNVV